MKKPSHEVFGTTKSGEKTYWTRLGVAFKNADDSINVILNFVPLDGKIQLREPKSDEGEGAE